MLNFLIFLYLPVFKISCSAELSMKFFHNFGTCSRLKRFLPLVGAWDHNISKPGAWDHNISRPALTVNTEQPCMASNPYMVPLP